VVLDRYPNSKLAASGIHAGPGELTFGSDRRQGADLTVVHDWGRVGYFNFHGARYHYEGHFPYCEAATATVACGGDPLPPPEVNEATLSGDDFKRGYAAALNAAGGPCRFEYASFYECQFFHGTFGDVDLRAYMEDRHGDDYVGGRPFVGIGQAALKSAIRSGRATGFVAIVGGSERISDKASRQFSFVAQRSKVSLDEVGEFTRDRIRDSGRGGRHYEEKSFTLTRRRVHPSAEPLCMSTAYLKWLMDERGFDGFGVVHFLHYNFRAYLAPFLLNLLRRRHVEKAKGTTAGDINSGILKLLGNSFYGYCSMQPTNYPVTSVVKQSGMRDYVQRHRGEIFDTSVVGLDRSSDPPQFLFAVTRRNERCKIANLTQVSSAILGNSKVVFLSHLLFLFRHLSPRKAELCYLDTGK